MYFVEIRTMVVAKTRVVCPELSILPWFQVDAHDAPVSLETTKVCKRHRL
jgi:hypothetical protein